MLENTVQNIGQYRLYGMAGHYQIDLPKYFKIRDTLKDGSEIWYWCKPLDMIRDILPDEKFAKEILIWDDRHIIYINDEFYKLIREPKLNNLEYFIFSIKS